LRSSQTKPGTIVSASMAPPGNWVELRFRSIFLSNGIGTGACKDLTILSLIRIVTAELPGGQSGPITPSLTLFTLSGYDTRRGLPSSYPETRGVVVAAFRDRIRRLFRSFVLRSGHPIMNHCSKHSRRIGG
jgi:hypothetical protein